jgi:hypothetical protein
MGGGVASASTAEIEGHFLLRVNIGTATASAVGHVVALITITGVVPSRRRVRQLEEDNKRRLTTKTLSVTFTLDTVIAAATIQTTLKTSFGLKMFGYGGFLQTAMTAVPIGFCTALADCATALLTPATFDGTQTVADPVVNAKTDVSFYTSGSFKMEDFDNVACSGAPRATFGGNILDASAAGCADSAHTVSPRSFQVAGCKSSGYGQGFSYASTNCAVGTGGPTFFYDGVCLNVPALGDYSVKVYCGQSASAGSTSDASTKSIAGVVFGLVMGLVSLI